ncbi:hypothetical protein HAX54_013245 [Datura stramonium]|uniref:Uncharacterized protein n=1 Tax=Datura stramonium TaxID=4076 RepID=A0ABS8Y302_DATST|nr:hypothetical protein [Datura stramonium]
MPRAPPSLISAMIFKVKYNTPSKQSEKPTTNDLGLFLHLLLSKARRWTDEIKEQDSDDERIGVVNDNENIAGHECRINVQRTEIFASPVNPMAPAFYTYKF